jgi:hypothetical protein
MLSPLVIDLETVVDDSVPADKPRADRYEQWLDGGWSAHSGGKLPATRTGHTLVRDASGDFPSLSRWRIVSVGILTYDGGFESPMAPVTKLAPLCAEGIAIRRVFELADSRTIVTYNGRRFDVPLLCLRALALGVPLPSWYQRSGARYRYRHEAHLDLHDYLSEYGAGRLGTLDQVARLIGLPGKGDGVDGISVAKMAADGRWDEIHRYCLSDVAQTALIERRVGYLTGRLSLKEMGEDIEHVLGLVDKDEKLAELAGRIDRGRLLLR